MLHLHVIYNEQAHCRAILCEVSWKEMARLSTIVSPNLAQVLLQMAELYLIYWALEKRGDLLMVSCIIMLVKA